jgi:hypothetical protein
LQVGLICGLSEYSDYSGCFVSSKCSDTAGRMGSPIKGLVK